MKILIISPSWIGDLVMSQSLFITLKAKHPTATIDALSPNWCRPILARMPEINKTIEMPLTHGQFNLSTRYRLGKALRQEKYTHAYILPNSAKSALIPFFAKIPTRTGWKGEMRYGLLTDLRNNKKSFKYMVERYIALAHPRNTMNSSYDLGGLSTLPKPNLQIDACAQQNAFIKFKLPTERKIIGLCPGAEFGPAKRWPETHFNQLAEKLIDQGFQIWLFGSEKDNNTCQKICDGLTVSKQDFAFNLAGKTSLTEAIDLIGACQTVVSNDSGLMHVAAAVGCNIVGIYGSTSPKYTPPLALNSKIVNTSIECRPCFKRECPLSHLKCLTELSVETVLVAINQLQSTKDN